MTIDQIKDKLKSTEYDFLRTDRNLDKHIIILTLGGSYAYGMNKEGSDLDMGELRLMENQKSCSEKILSRLWIAIRIQLYIHLIK